MAAASSSPKPPEPTRAGNHHGQDHPLQRRRAPAPAGRGRPARRHGQGHAGAEGPQRGAGAPDRRADDHQRRRVDRARDRAGRPVRQHGRAARPRGRRQDVGADRRRDDDRDAARAVAGPGGHAGAGVRHQPHVVAPRDRGGGRRWSSPSCCAARSPSATRVTWRTSRRSPPRRTSGSAARSARRCRASARTASSASRRASCRGSRSTSSKGCMSRTGTSRRT